jgi:Zn finger protein HypA/HybF involved in hydrogenase expression
MVGAAVRLDPQQLKLILERLDRIVTLLEAEAGLEPSVQKCPRCQGENLAEGDHDVMVCAQCGANILNGELVCGPEQEAR